MPSLNPATEQPTAPHRNRAHPVPAHRAPSLRISNVVYGRERVGNRVRYLVDPKGGPSDLAIPEKIVLRRWRARKTPAGYTFAGTRLGPHFWRALATAFPDGLPSDEHPTAEQIQAARDASHARRKRLHYSLPSARCLHALFRAMGTSRLKTLIARHTDPERVSRYGTPDLFLYATHTDPTRTPITRFVEVKRPNERVSPDQVEEIAFLNALGVPARVLRLIERGVTQPQTT